MTPAEENFQIWHEDNFQAFCQAMRNEWLVAREDFEPFHSLHEGYAVLLEEVEELKEQTFRQFDKRNRQEIIKECVQIAAMAFCVLDECLWNGVQTWEIDNYRVE